MVATEKVDDASSQPSRDDGADSPPPSRHDPIKVCVLVEPSPFSYVSGYAGRFQNLILHLKERGDDVQVITPATVRWKGGGSHPPDPTEWNGVPIHTTGGVPLMPFYPDLIVSIDYALKIPRILWKMRPDLLHVSSPGFLVFWAVLYGRAFRIPVLASYHTHLPVYVQSHYLPKPIRNLAASIVWLLIRWVHGHLVDMTVVTSPQIRDEFVRHGVPSEQCRVWRKGVDCDTFHPGHFSLDMRRRITNNHPDDFVMLCVGRISAEKRLALLRPVLDRLILLDRQKNSALSTGNVRLCFVGSGPQEEELRALFAGTPTVFMGVLTGNELSQAYASADVFVMPSDSETLGFVVLEAMASGVVPVVTKAGGLVDLVRHNDTGFLVELSEDHDEYVQQFAYYVHQLQRDNERRRAMGQRARNETLQWSWSESMRSIREIDYGMTIRRLRNRWNERLWRLVTWQS
jgi:sulfoquinovosyltransferase